MFSIFIPDDRNNDLHNFITSSVGDPQPYRRHHHCFSALHGVYDEVRRGILVNSNERIIWDKKGNCRRIIHNGKWK